MLIGVLGGHYFTAISQGQESPAPLLANARAMFDVIPAPTPEELQTPLVQLGRRLFWDERLSVNGQVACASCHLASHWGADAERFSLDAKEKRTKRNSQTVFNAMLQPQLRWTGDRTSGAHQAERSLTGSMGFANSDDVLELLRQHEYEKSFKRAFPFVVDSMSSANYARAIEAYESTLRTPAPFDLYLNGQTDVLSDKQVAGLQFFMELGCADCHSGQLIGGESLNKFGVHHDYWTETGSVNRDVGLFELTTNEEDRYRFRTSMLRNIEKTGPFFHDGSVASLPEAVRVMAKVQLDQELDSGQLEAIVAFLGSLTGEVPANYSQPDAPSELSPEILNDAVQPNAVEFRSLRIRSFRNRASSDSRRPAK
jgi:cytochrome c peroxidase